MLARRIKRDVTERGRDVDGILEQSVLSYVGYPLVLTNACRYLRYVKPAYDNFVGPTSKYADIARAHLIDNRCSYSYHLQVVPGSDNAVAIELISTHIRRQLNERAGQFRKQMAHNERLTFIGEENNHPNLILLPQTPQLKVRLISETHAGASYSHNLNDIHTGNLYHT